MKVLFFTHYFPPEVNAPASRTYEHACRWVQEGHEVTVITCAPNMPDGIVFGGYKNRWRQTEVIDGIRVVRVWTYIAANKGTFKRILNYLSYVPASVAASLFEPKADALIATSPQYFAGWAGLIAAALKRMPFFIEVRDIMPEDIIASSAIKNPWILKPLFFIDKWLNRWTRHFITVGPTYRDNLVKKGIDPKDIDIVTNGVDPDLFAPTKPDLDLKKSLGLEDKFICSWTGTIGIKSALHVVNDAALILKNKGRNDIAFLMVGDGAIREDLERVAKQQGLDNVVFTGRQAKDMIPRYLSISDVCLAHTPKATLYTTVIASKIFEVMAMQRPIVIGMRGVSEEIILDAGVGIGFEQENGEELAALLIKLADDPKLCSQLGENGRQYVMQHYNRNKLALDYISILEKRLGLPGSRDTLAS